MLRTVRNFFGAMLLFGGLAAATLPRHAEPVLPPTYVTSAAVANAAPLRTSTRDAGQAALLIKARAARRSG